jgi:hypothetical protein
LVSPIATATPDGKTRSIKKSIDMMNAIHEWVLVVAVSETEGVLVLSQ